MLYLSTLTARYEVQRRAWIFFWRSCKVESAEIWHWCVQHSHRRSLDVLKMLPSNGVINTREVEACGTCLLEKSEQQAQLKHITYDVRRPSELVIVDTMKSITL